MRHLNHIVKPESTKYVLLVEKPRDPRYSNDVIAFYYLSYEDLREGPSGAEVFTTWPVEDVKAYLEDECGFDPTTWQVIPDSEPGEPQDRIADDCAIAAVTVVDQVRHWRTGGQSEGDNRLKASAGGVVQQGYPRRTALFRCLRMTATSRFGLTPKSIDPLPSGGGCPPHPPSEPTAPCGDLPHQGGGGGWLRIPQKPNDQPAPTSPLVGEVVPRCASTRSGWGGRVNTWFSGFGLTSLVLATAFVGCSRPKPAVVPTALPEVVVELPVEKLVTDYEDFTGRTRASKAADLKTQVTAELKEIGFVDGRDVAAGQLLFTLDQTVFLADVEKAKADVDRATAEVERARAEIDRAKAVEAEATKEYQLNKNALGGANQLELIKSEGAMRVAAAAVKAADGSLRVAQAAVRVAERLQAVAQNYVDYTLIRAPFAGRIGRRLVDAGNRVKQDDTVLARLLQLDPLDVEFDLDDRTLLRLNELTAGGRNSAAAAAGGWRFLGGGQQRLREKVRVGLPNSDDFSLDGTVTFIDNQVNASTSTIQVRAEVANPNGAVEPGLFVRVRVWIGDPRPAVLVREEAVAIDQQLKVVYVVNAEDKVESRKVRLGQQEGAYRVVEPLPEDPKSGVRPGERVIVAGVQRVQHGTKVTPKLAK